MLILKRNGHVFVPTTLWLLCAGLGAAAPAVFGNWRAFILDAVLCLATGALAIAETTRISRTGHDVLTLRRGWRRTEVPLSGAFLTVEYAFRAYYRVVLSGGTPVTGPMLLGNSLRSAKRIGENLELPVRVPRELEDQVRKLRGLWVILPLVLLGASVVGAVSFFLLRRQGRSRANSAAALPTRSGRRTPCAQR
jgi:hypothetical protein